MANSSFSRNLPFSSKSLLFKRPLWTPLNFRQTFGEFSPNLSFLPFSSLVTFQGAPLDILEFSPSFDQLSPDLPFSLLHAFRVITKS